MQTQLDLQTAQLIVHYLVAAVPARAGDTVRVHLVAGTDQGPPSAVAQLAGRTYSLTPTEGGGWALPAAQRIAAQPPAEPGSYEAANKLQDVSSSIGVDFRQGSFRFGVSTEAKAMMGGGVCFLDYDDDGWIDLFAVDSYASADAERWQAKGGLPTSALFRNVHGRFTNVTKKAHAGLAVQGDGCVAGDLDGDGRTDLVVTTTDGVAVLWNRGGSFERQDLPGPGWYTGAAIGDVNGDGRPDLFTAGYADPNTPAPGSYAGFPTNLAGVRDLLS